MDDDARVRQSLKNASSSVRRRFASRRFLVSVPGRTFSSATTRTAIARDDLRRQNATRTRASSITRSMTHTTTLSRARDPSFDSFMIQRSMGIDDDRVVSAPSHRPHAPRGARARRGRSRTRDRGRKRERVHDERANECARGNEGQKVLTSACVHRRHRATRDDRETNECARWYRVCRSRDSR